MDRVILHSDCNSFYASVELLKRPELRNKPVAVGGDVAMRHGIILAKNEAAKARGVKTGEALWQAREHCADLIILPPHYEEYVRFSAAARKIYFDYTDRVEPFGLDEAWLDVTGDDGAAVADEIRRRVLRELGITVSVGVSFNKTFAKLGSDYKKPNAVTLIPREGFAAIVWPLPATDLLGVGPATGGKLARRGILTIGHLAQADPAMIRSMLGKVGLDLRAAALGLDASPVLRPEERPPVKSIGNSSTLPRDLVDRTDAARVLYVLADSVGRRLREQGLMGRRVSLWMRDNTLLSFQRQAALKRPTDATFRIHEAALALLDAHYRWERPMRSAGVSVGELVHAGEGVQMDFFADTERSRRWEALEAVGDRLKNRYGNKCLVPATLLADPALTGFDPKRDHVIRPAGDSLLFPPEEGIA